MRWQGHRNERGRRPSKTAIAWGCRRIVRLFLSVSSRPGFMPQAGRMPITILIASAFHY
jgi:hypothetical protein